MHSLVKNLAKYQIDFRFFIVYCAQILIFTKKHNAYL